MFYRLMVVISVIISLYQEGMKVWRAGGGERKRKGREVERWERRERGKKEEKKEENTIEFNKH